MSDLVGKVLKCKNRHIGPEKIVMSSGTTSWIECQNCGVTYTKSIKIIDRGDSDYLYFRKKADYNEN